MFPPPAVSPPANGSRERALAALGRLPPFSPILSKLMATLAGGNASFVVLGDLIEKDAVVAANILRVVNSAAYARREPVNSVRRAISILGVEKVRNTVLAISIARMLHQARTPAGWSMERFNRHAAAVAMLADLIAQRLPTEYPEGAFAAGLLHDLGRLLIATGLPEDYAAVRQHHRQSGQAWFACEQDLLGFDHADLSASAMNDWRLPAEIRDAIHLHHAPPPVRDGRPLPLARVLLAANTYVDSLGLRVEPSSAPPEPAVNVILELGLSPDLLAQFHSEHDAMAAFFA